MRSATAHLTYLTQDLPGTGGVIKDRPEDFLVEEQPLYEPCGEGEHLYLFIEKTQQTTTDIVRRLAKLFSVKRTDIGYAGLKDKHAVTRQHFSIYKPDPSDDEKLISRIEFTKFQLLWAARHTNKLKRGHHGGNRFVIFIRDVDPTSVIHAKRALDILCETGVPNFVGDQRYGYRQNNHLLARHMILREWDAFLQMLLGDVIDTDPPDSQKARRAFEAGDYKTALNLWPRQMRHDRRVLDALLQNKSPERAVLALDAMQLEFLVSSMQSAVFNEMLNDRVKADQLGVLLEGDLAWKHDSRAVFPVDAETAALENGPQGRIASHDVSPSGPMWGPDMLRARGDVELREMHALEAFGLTVDDLANSPRLVDGQRRPMRVFLRDPDISAGVDEHGAHIRVAFELPRGSFATMVLREIMKPCVDATTRESRMARGGLDDMPKGESK